MPEGKELVDSIQNKKFYLTGKTLWVWIACTVAVAGWAVTGILWYQDSQDFKQFKKSQSKSNMELWQMTNKQNESISALTASTENLSNLLTVGLENQNKLINFRLSQLERYHNVSVPHPEEDLNSTPPPINTP